MIAVIVPAHEEAAELGDCLFSIAEATTSARLEGEPCRVVVVADACSDATASIARGMGAQVLEIAARNVGMARRAGAQAALEVGARWLAFTDADTRVSRDWLAEQLALRRDVVCGTVGIRDWGDYTHRARRAYRAEYTDSDAHRHVHGANLGASARAYARVGGFPALRSGEDVAFVERAQAHGLTIAWSRAPRVWTSTRRTHRAPGGFGAFLRKLEHVVEEGSASPSHAAGVHTGGVRT
ncbi:MAG: glycosyltransferase [Polyangiaceae bacterium]|nr:glycosyltransferase [Polyangiaceae bacterium]